MITSNKIIRIYYFALLICLFSFSCTAPVSDCKEGGVVITFDDRYIDEWYSLRPLLNTYNAKVTFFVTYFDSLNEDQIKKLEILKNDGHEIAFHGLRHLNAVNFVKDNSVEKYLEVEILPGINIMKNKEFYPISFSYPFGAHTSRIDNALLTSFKHLRATAYTNETKRIIDLNQVYYKCNNGKIIYGVGIDNNYKNDIEEIYKGLKRALEKKEVIILYAHKISNESGDYTTPIDKLEAILKYASENGLKFYRVSDL